MTSFSLLLYLCAEYRLIQTYIKTKENILIKYLKLKHQIDNRIFGFKIWFT